MATISTHRVWTGVIWEESMDPNMINNFEEEGIRAFIIRHDKDKYNDGTSLNLRVSKHRSSSM